MVIVNAAENEKDESESVCVRNYVVFILGVVKFMSFYLGFFYLFIE